MHAPTDSVTMGHRLIFFYIRPWSGYLWLLVCFLFSTEVCVIHRFTYTTRWLHYVCIVSYCTFADFPPSQVIAALTIGPCCQIPDL